MLLVVDFNENVAGRLTIYCAIPWRLEFRFQSTADVAVRQCQLLLHYGRGWMRWLLDYPVRRTRWRCGIRLHRWQLDYLAASTPAPELLFCNALAAKLTTNAHQLIKISPVFFVLLNLMVVVILHPLSSSSRISQFRPIAALICQHIDNTLLK